MNIENVNFFVLFLAFSQARRYLYVCDSTFYGVLSFLLFLLVHMYEYTCSSMYIIFVKIKYYYNSDIVCKTNINFNIYVKAKRYVPGFQ